MIHLSLHAFFIKASQASLILPAVMGLVYYRRLDKSFKLLFWFLIASILFEIQASVLKEVFHNNMPGLHLYTFLEFITFSTLFYSHFTKNKTFHWLLILNIVAFIVISIADAMFINGIWKPNGLSRTYSSVSLVILSLLFFYQLFADVQEFYIWEYPMFWFSAAILIYFGLNIFYFMLNNYLIKNMYSVAFNGMRVHAAINILANCIFAKSFACFKTSTRKY